MHRTGHRPGVAFARGCTALRSRLTAYRSRRTAHHLGRPCRSRRPLHRLPGADEDARGEPFVGEAGKLLDAMLAAINLQRGNNVYITNVLKSRPPGNREPESDEIAACRPYLLAQIELIQPRLILALGRVAAQSLLATDETVGHLRGRVHQFQGVPLVVTYHPAYLLRKLSDKARAWEDLCLARRTFNSLTPES
ncbi:MAG: hypothetical protein B7Z35_07740 [Hydrogenophilales bacterium 12-61-10]|nr:MAG: hypothetical protein B7Z35_07740 [Hydrogenophilales bacterium 12-61-10]